MDQKLKKSLLNKIKPDKNEEKELKQSVNSFLLLLEKTAKELNFDLTFIVGGSFGKNTYIKGDFDVDIFASFDLKYEKEDISEYLFLILSKSNISFIRQKGSRDYFSGEYNFKKNFKFEIIPNLKIKTISQAKNSTDFSPLHLKFLQDKISKNPSLSDEIRLAKLYFKAKGFYGAESYVNGFSGHSIDILIIYYGSLEELIFSAKNWREQTIIDINNISESTEKLLKEVDSSKHSNLILIDPVDSKRNASKALSRENYEKFVLNCMLQKEFTQKDFEKKSICFKNILNNAIIFEKESGYFCLSYKIIFTLENQSQDIVGTKLYKIFQNLEKYFLSYDFIIQKKDFYIDINKGEVLFLYFFKQSILSKLKLVTGPSIYLKEAVLKFSESKEEIFVKNSKICSYQKRKIINLDEVSNIDLDLLKEIFSKDISFIKYIKKV